MNRERPIGSVMPHTAAVAMATSMIQAGGEPLSLVQACWHAVVLGIVQGLTEFLPISSSAHLKVVPVLLGWGDPGVAFTAVIQLGSIVAVIAYFRSDLQEVLAGMSRAFRNGTWSDPSARLGVAIALGTLPIVVVGMGGSKRCSAIVLHHPILRRSSVNGNSRLRCGSPSRSPPNRTL